MAKVEQMNILQESNGFLREEKEKMSAQLTEAEQKVGTITWYTIYVLWNLWRWEAYVYPYKIISVPPTQSPLKKVMCNH